MYIDKSRIADLARLKERIDDVRNPIWFKKKTQRVYDDILKQLKDPKLAKLREEYVNAAQKSDPDTAKIALRIKAYLKEERDERYEF